MRRIEKDSVNESYSLLQLVRTTVVRVGHLRTIVFAVVVTVYRNSRYRPSVRRKDGGAITDTQMLHIVLVYQYKNQLYK